MVAASAMHHQGKCSRSIILIGLKFALVMQSSVHRMHIRGLRSVVAGAGGRATCPPSAACRVYQVPLLSGGQVTRLGLAQQRHTIVRRPVVFNPFPCVSFGQESKNPSGQAPGNKGNRSGMPVACPCHALRGLTRADRIESTTKVISGRWKRSKDYGINASPPHRSRPLFRFLLPVPRPSIPCCLRFDAVERVD